MYSYEPDGGGVYLGDGEWLSWDEFGEYADIDPDEPQPAVLPVLEWQDWLKRKYPNAELPVLRQFIRLVNAAEEYFEQTGKHLNIYGALGELYGAMIWGVRLHKLPDAQGSDGKLDNDFIEIKTIGPRSTTDQALVKLSGHFNKLLVVKIDRTNGDDGFGCFRMSGRMIDRKALTNARSGNARIKWSRACEIGVPPPVG